MSDGLPDDEQLRRIRRRVRERIERRRTAVRGVVTGAVVVVLLTGGIGLVARTVGSGGATSTSGGSSGSGARVLVVECHGSSAEGSATAGAKVPRGASDAEVAAACGAAAVDFQSGSGRVPSASSGSAAASSAAGSSPSAAPTGLRAVVCRAEDGVLHVYPADDDPRTLCEREGLRPR